MTFFLSCDRGRGFSGGRYEPKTQARLTALLVRQRRESWGRAKTGLIECNKHSTFLSIQIILSSCSLYEAMGVLNVLQ